MQFPRKRLPFLLGLTLIAVAWRFEPAGALAERPDSLLARADTGRLQKITRNVRQLRAAAQPQPRSGDLLDVRAVIHAHSYLSHDSQGTPEEILAAARKTGVRALFMTDHYTPDRRHLKEALRGERDGILCIPGTELTDGLLLFRADEVPFDNETPAPALLEQLNGRGALAFICHPEARTNWDLPPFPAMEIYNTHADLEDHAAELKELAGNASNVPQLYAILNAFERFPAAGFACIFDLPTLNLRVWDQLTQKRKVTGIAGNDSHQNLGIVVEVGDKKLMVKDRSGKVLTELNRNLVPPPLFGRLLWKTGEKVVDRILDPYELSFGYVSTHILAPEVSEPALFDALLAGRAYVAFDWLADPSGFSFTGAAGESHALMGSDLPAGPDTRLEARASLACRWRLLRNGQPAGDGQGREFTALATQPGVYRVEAWLDVAEEPLPWVYSNPIYVR
ncbi:MAG: hypothetical protein HY320_09445 [Armatimonadetes bacterium]|nr:hypothetical protein [Armatimonadota bacterium]